MHIAKIIEMPGATERDYDAAFAAIHPGGIWPEGQVAHIAGPTEDGFRVIDVWESREAFERFEAAVLAPIGLAGVPATEFEVRNTFVRTST